MSIFAQLKKYLFHSVDMRTDPPTVESFEKRGQAVMHSYKLSHDARHSRRYDNCYVIPASKGKASKRK